MSNLTYMKFSQLEYIGFNKFTFMYKLQTSSQHILTRLLFHDFSFQDGVGPEPSCGLICSIMSFSVFTVSSKVQLTQIISNRQVKGNKDQNTKR